MNNTVLFTCGNDRFTPGHVLAASALWGELDALEGAVRRRDQASRHARSNHVEIGDDLLQQSSEDFRRAYGLRTASATAAWMKARGVSLETFTDFLERDALARWDADASGGGGETVEILSLEALWTDAVFTGVGDQWCQRLAARVAVARETLTPDDVPASLFGPEVPEAWDYDALRRRAAQFGLPASAVEAAVTRERAFARFAETVQTPQRLDAAMRTRWDALFSLDFELGAFASEAAAREACLCVTEDGDSIETVCTRAAGSFQAGQVLLEELPHEVRPHALSATAGSLLPVFGWNGHHIVCRVREKKEPSLDDVRIREAVAQDVLLEAVTPLVARHIAWSAGDAG